MCPNATIVFVMLVPMFAPMIRGMAFPIVSAPVAVSPTITEVVTELLCTIAVAKIPINSAMNGFVVSDTSFSAKSVPNSLNDAPINCMLSRKM